MRANGIRQFVDSAPPLSPEQRDRLALLLAPSQKSGKRKRREFSPEQWAKYQKSVHATDTGHD